MFLPSHPERDFCLSVYQGLAGKRLLELMHL
ncbi:unnamed protein product [Coffea canephora]|uniref:Uncharacterized protein n=1 Tax=Coffea canephora TaxID=49390 RepID=A0A068U298_COFCA|nr:unnamed protein product [Coffea canephora]